MRNPVLIKSNVTGDLNFRRRETFLSPHADGETLFKTETMENLT